MQHEDGILPVNVASRAGKFVPETSRKERKGFAREAIEAVLKVARERHPEILSAVLPGFRAGLRIGEVCALPREDVDFEAGTLTVRRTNHKGHVDSPGGARELVILYAHPVSDAREIVGRLDNAGKSAIPPQTGRHGGRRGTLKISVFSFP